MVEQNDWCLGTATSEHGCIFWKFKFQIVHVQYFSKNIYIYNLNKIYIICLKALIVQLSCRALNSWGTLPHLCQILAATMPHLCIAREFGQQRQLHWIRYYDPQRDAVPEVMAIVKLTCEMAQMALTCIHSDDDIKYNSALTKVKYIQ